MSSVVNAKFKSGKERGSCMNTLEGNATEQIRARVREYYWKDDLSCLVTTLKILSEVFDLTLHPQVLSAAYGLNAGRCGAQCGIVEGSLLFLGIYRNERVPQIYLTYCAEFQRRFGSLLCSELRPQGFLSSNPPHLCETLTKSAIEFSAEFVLNNRSQIVK